MTETWTVSQLNLSSVTPFQRSVHLAAIEVSVLATVFVLTVIGNVLVLLVLVGGGRKLTRMTVMIVHLSCADLFVAFFNVLPQLSWKLTGYFRGNDLLCRSVVYLWLVAMYGSSYVLVSTALDRYLAICRPLTSYAWTGDKSKYLVATSWILSLLFALPQIAVFGYQPMDAYTTGVYNCWAIFRPTWTMKLYVTWSTLAIYVIPAAILAATYGRICYSVWTGTRIKERASVQSTGGTTTSTSVRSDRVKVEGSERQRSGTRLGRLFRHLPGLSERGDGPPPPPGGGYARKQLSVDEQRSVKLVTQRSHVKIMTKAKIRTVKLTLAVNVSYIVCWGPYFICQVWSAFDETAPYDGAVMTVLVLLASLNSCTNPWIYIVFVDNIRISVSRLFNRIFCSCLCTTSPTIPIPSRQCSDPVRPLPPPPRIPTPPHYPLPPPPPPPLPIPPQICVTPHQAAIPNVAVD